jgi:phytoene dehydrogenase-like protein
MLWLYGYAANSPRSINANYCLSMVYFFVSQGAFYPQHGPLFGIAWPLVRNIQKYGGKVAIRAPVKDILVQDDKVTGVRLADGQVFKAPQVVSSAGLLMTYKNMMLQPSLSQSKPSASANVISELKRRVDTMEKYINTIVEDHREDELGWHCGAFVGLRGDAVELNLPT